MSTTIDRPSEYLDQLWKETERWYRGEVGRSCEINRLSLHFFDYPLSFQANVRVGKRITIVTHYIEPHWPLEKNAFKLAQKIHENIQLSRSVIL